MKSIIKKVALSLALIIVCFACCSCGASVDCVYLRDAYGINWQYNIRINEDIVDELEDSCVDGRWTVAAYIETLASVMGASYYGKQTDGADELFIVTRTVDESDTDESEEDEPSYTIERGFLQNRYSYKTDNPFNGLRAEYDAEAESGSLMDILKNGITLTIGAREVTLPAFESAFPAASAYNKDNIELNFYWLNSRIEPINGEPYNDFYSGQSGAVWTSKFDLTDREIEYYYYAPNAWGWYTVILLIGVAVVVIILLTNRKSKQQPRFVKAGKRRRPSRVRVIYINPDGGVDRDIYGEKKRPDIYSDEPTSSFDPYSQSKSKADRAREELEDIFSNNDHENKD